MSSPSAALDLALLQDALKLLEQSFAIRPLTLDDGAVVSLRSCGTARTLPTVVLLHGISSGAASWLHMALSLAEHTEVLAWDAPGYGATSALPGQAPADLAYGDRLAQALAARGVGEHVVVGHSLGALMAMAYASRRPAGLQQVLLISPARGYGAPGQEASQAKVRQDRLAALERLGVAGLAEGISARLLSAQAAASARAWVRWNTARLQVAGYRQAVELLCQSDLSRHAAALAVPVSVWCGAEDVVTPPAGCAQWAEQHGYPFTLIPDAGHASPVEQPQAVAQCVLQALMNRDTGAQR